MSTSGKILLAASVLAVVTASSAFAITYQWDTDASTVGFGGTGSWGGSNWDPVGGDDLGLDPTGPVTFTNSDAALFIGTGSVTLDVTPVNINALTFAAGSNYSFDTGANTLTLGGTSPVITVGTTGQATTTSLSISALKLGATTTIQANGATAVNKTTVAISGPITGAFSLNLFGNFGDARSTFNLTTNAGSAAYNQTVNLRFGVFNMDSTVVFGTGSNPIRFNGGNNTNKTILNFSGMSGPQTTTHLIGVLNYNTSNPANEINNNDADSSHTLTLNGIGDTVANNASNIPGGSKTTVALGGTNTGNNVFNQVVNDVTAGTNLITTSVLKQGSGTWVLKNSNTYSGGTTVNGGTLITGNASALGASAVGFGNGNVTVTSGVLQVGDGAVNTLTLGSAATLAFADNSTLKLGATTSQITMGATGTFTIGTGVNIDITGLGLGVGDYTLVDGFVGGNSVGTWNQASDLIGGNFGSFNYDFKLVGNDAVLSVTVVPEPGSLSALLGGTGVLLGLRRRRA